MKIDRKLDPLLEPFVAAASARDADRRLDALMKDHAESVILATIRRKLKIVLGRTGGPRQTQDELNAEDVYSAAVTQIVGRMNGLRADPIAVIGDFCGYAATVASNACDAFLRLKYPKRQFVKNRLRYLFSAGSGQEGLVAWPGSRGETLCGFETWRDGGHVAAHGDMYQQMMAAPVAFARAALENEEARQANPAVLVAALLDRVGGPVDLDDLVQVVGEVLEIKDYAPVVESADSDDRSGRPEERIAAPLPRVSETVVGRMYLQKMWEQVCELPPRQRAAVLLNLRDERGRGVIALLPILGIAALPEIATALEMPGHELAAIWNDLPIEDNAVAERLGVTRQQVINLRKVARERLGRRLSGW